MKESTLPQKEKQEKHIKKELQQSPKQIETEKPDFKGIVRLAGKDIHGTVKLKRALLYVKGIGPTLAVSVSNILNKEMGLLSEMEIGDLNDEQIEKIDRILFNLHDYKLPLFLLDRQNDSIEGHSKHIIMSDLLFAWKQDIEKEKKTYTWKGYRHAYGQKVRGQRTRNTGRTGMAVGVLRKAVLAAQQKEAAPAGAVGVTGQKPAGAPAKTTGPAPKAAASAAAVPASGQVGKNPVKK